jgi:hypothetical protein
VYAEDAFQLAAAEMAVAAEVEVAAAAEVVAAAEEEAAREPQGALRMLIHRARQRETVVTAELKLKEEAAPQRCAVEQAKYYSTPGRPRDAPHPPPEA